MVTWTANFNRKLIAARLSDMLCSILPGNIFCDARGFKNGLARFRSGAITNFLQRSVTFLDNFFHRFWTESDLTEFLEVFFADFLLEILKKKCSEEPFINDVVVSTVISGILFARFPTVDRMCCCK